MSVALCERASAEQGGCERRDEHVVVSVLLASLVAAVLGGAALYQRDRHHAHVARTASRDTDRTG